MIQFKIENMMCGGCAAAVKRAIAALDAHASVDIDRAARLVQVEPRATDAAAIEAALRRAGYRAVPA